MVAVVVVVLESAATSKRMKNKLDLVLLKETLKGRILLPLAATGGKRDRGSTGAVVVMAVVVRVVVER